MEKSSKFSPEVGELAVRRNGSCAMQTRKRFTVVGLDAYYRNVRHLQDEGQFGNALIFPAFNYKQGRIYGVDLSATYRKRAFSRYMNVGLTSAMGKGVETGQFNFAQDELDCINEDWVHLDHEQRLTASAGTSYRFEGNLTLSADLCSAAAASNDLCRGYEAVLIERSQYRWTRCGSMHQ